MLKTNSSEDDEYHRMMTTERAIKQTQVSVSRVRRAIEKKLQQRVRLHRSRAREENLRLRISLLEQEIVQRQSKLEQEKLACQARNKEQADRAKELENIASDLVAKRNSLVEQRRQYFQVRENLLKASSMLALRQKELISELAFVYPIAQFPDKKGYSICFVHLPNSEDFNDRDDLMISVALGYVTHVLLMMSHFLDVPLRYPLIHYGTNSSVRDNLVEHFSDKEREFPLYLKGKEKMLFNYSVYLLNRNIAQLRCNCNLATKDLRFTLHNLHGLFEHYSIKASGSGQVSSSALLPAPSQSVPVPIQNNNHHDVTDNLPSSDEVLSPPVQPPPIEGSFPSCTSHETDGELATSPKLSSSLDEGLDQLQVSSAETKLRQSLAPNFQSLQASQHSSEPNLREFEARNALRVRQGGASIEECLLPVPPVVYDATEESASLHSGDGVEVEVAVDTLFDADLTARTEVLANIVRSFQTYAPPFSSNVPSTKQ
ncbi:UV radiation resistance-associated protein isoform X1 [Ixodes scapularis]